MEPNDTVPVPVRRRVRNVRSTGELIKFVARIPEATYTELAALADLTGQSRNATLAKALKIGLTTLAKAAAKTTKA